MTVGFLRQSSLFLKICCFQLVLLCIMPVMKCSVPSNVTIGVIFSITSEGDAERKAFELAIAHVNSDGSVLPSTQLQYIINNTISRDPLSNIQKACHQISNGVTAVFGPVTSTDIKAITTVTTGLKIPLYSSQATNPAFSFDHKNYPFLLRMDSSDDMNSRVLTDVFKRFLWQRVAVLTSNSDYARGFAADFYNKAIKNNWIIAAIEEFNAIHDYNNLDVRTQLTRIKKRGVHVVLLSCGASYTPVIMRQAKELLMIKNWAWILTDSTFDPPSPIAEELIGLLGVRDTIDGGTLASVLTSGLKSAGFSTNPVSYAATKRFDSVLAFAKGLHDFFQAGYRLSNSTPTCESCGEERIVSGHGDTLMNYLKKVQTNGASHFLNFSSSGSPGVARFHIMNLHSSGWLKIGNWEESQGLAINSSGKAMMWPGGVTDIPVDSTYTLGNTTLNLVTVIEPGFIQLKKGKSSTDPDPYEGYCIDLLKRLAKDLHFNYTLTLVPDGKYGNYDANNKRWNGMVGELVDKKFDMALAPITISQSRSEVIDFSKPYMDLGLSILMQIPEKTETNIFGFVDPLSREVWFTAFSIMALVAVISLLLDKISPNGHYGSVVQAELDEGCDREEVEEELEGLTYLNLTNSVWFSIGALLQQGGDVLPRAVSGRTVAAFWWAASMILIATYTANLAAYLTFGRMKLTINSVEALGSQTKISYGTVKNSPAAEFFEESILPSYNAMYQFMRSRGTLANSVDDALKRVREDNVAFIFDSILLEAEMYKKPCNVFTVGSTFGKFGYGLALQKDSPFTTRFSLEILKLREKGVLLYFEDYWFKRKGDCIPDLSMLELSNGQLTLKDMIGVKYVVYAGIGLGLILITVELCVASFWEVDPTDPRKPKTWSEAMKKRLRRIWDDIKDRLPKVPGKLKSLRKSSRHTSSVTAVTTVSKVKLEANESAKLKEENVNKGYQKDDVHPFEIRDR